jgi:hypothetical protein
MTGGSGRKAGDVVEALAANRYLHRLRFAGVGVDSER